MFTVNTGVQGALFLVEDPDESDVLTRNALLEWKTNSDSLRAATRDVRDNPLNSHLVTVFNTDLNAEVDGVYSIVAGRRRASSLAGNWEAQDRAQ